MEAAGGLEWLAASPVVTTLLQDSILAGINTLAHTSPALDYHVSVALFVTSDRPV